MQTSEAVEVEALADVHVHLREVGEIMRDLIVDSVTGGADVLGTQPNTKKELTTAKSVVEYNNRAREFAPVRRQVTFIPFVMITEETTEQDIDECVAAGIVDGKFYPKLRTTKSENGIVRYGRMMPIVKHCGKVGMKCHYHPEHPWMRFNNRDAEFAFLPIAKMYLEETDAIIVWEHGTDARCIPFWEDMATSGRFAVTLTGHHLATNEDATFGDVRSVCKPPIKTESDRLGLVDLVVKDYPWVMAGGDSAFHDESAKHVEEGRCACGACTARFLLSLYAHALEPLFATPAGVQTFINFTSRNARKFHNLPASSRTIKLVREPLQIPLSYTVGNQTASPFWAGQTLNRKIVP